MDRFATCSPRAAESAQASVTARGAHETIYRSLFIQARGVLKKELIAHLRTRRTMRRSRRAGAKNELRGQIPDAVSIRDRPAEIEDRAIPGHWEGDLISGSKNSHIVTLVERHSRYTALVKVKNGDRDRHRRTGATSPQTPDVAAPLTDLGSRTRDVEAQSLYGRYRCAGVLLRSFEPVAAWVEREHEWLVAQYFPKGTDLSVHSQSDLDRVALRLNQRPRETLGFQTPAAKLRDSVALTH